MTGLAIERSCPPGVRCPGADESLLVWSTRPRGTAAVFLVNLPFALWATRHDFRTDSPPAPTATWSAAPEYHHDAHLKFAVQTHVYPAVANTPALLSPPCSHIADHKGTSWLWFWKRNKGTRENIFFKSCVTAFVVEFFTCFIGVPVWFHAAFTDTTSHISQVGRSTCGFMVLGMRQNDERSAWATCSPGAIKMMFIASLGMMAGFVMFALSGVIVVACSVKRSRSEMIRRRCEPNLPLWVVPWVFLTGATVFNWMMWVTFLKDTADEDYCIGDITVVDTVNFVYIVIVNIWRQAV